MTHPLTDRAERIAPAAYVELLLNLTRREVRGRDHICSLNGQPLREASVWIEEMRGFWELRLDALERHLIDKRRKLQ